MSNDPFKELFGDAVQEPGERVQTAQLPETRTRPTKGQGAATTQKLEKVDHPAKPWVIVGIIAVVALLASVLVINWARSSDAGETASPAATEAPAPDDSTPGQDPDASDDETADDEEADDDSVPEVVVGDTFSMEIPAWGVAVDVSGRLGGDIRYTIQGQDEMIVSSSLIDSLPSSCSTGQWGMKRVSDDTFEVLKPSERCAEAPEVYDELWGQLDAMAKSAKPL